MRSNIGTDYVDSYELILIETSIIMMLFLIKI